MEHSSIITYGTYDCLHYGHVRLLKRAKSFGKYLILGLSTDEFNEKKGKKCVQTYEQRKEVLEMLPIIDLIIPENSWEQKKDDMKTLNALLVMGDDWRGKFDDLGCIYVPRTKGISSTIIKNTYE